MIRKDISLEAMILILLIFLSICNAINFRMNLTARAEVKRLKAEIQAVVP